MIDSPGSERQKILSFFFPSLPLFCFHLLFSAYPGPCRAQRQLARLVAGLFLRLDGKKGPCELSRSIASNLQACPTWPQGPPAAHCHDGQLQQLINYAEAINALGKHSSDVSLLSISLSLCFSTTNNILPPPILIQCAESLSPYRVSAGRINKGNVDE